MESGEFSGLAAQALYLVLLLSTPALLVSLVVGFVVALAQAVTQVQEQTLTFVPKLVAVSAALAVGGTWMGSELLRFTRELWFAIPSIGG